MFGQFAGWHSKSESIWDLNPGDFVMTEQENQQKSTLIEVCCAFDRHLVTAAEVMFVSLAKNAAASTEYRISVLCSSTGLDSDSRERLMQVFRGFSRHSIRFIEVGSSFEGAFEIRGITVPTYYRLLLPELMSDVPRVLYLDVDLIIQDDLRSLFETDLEGMSLAGVKGIYTNFSRERVESLGISLGGYVNAGVLLMNLDLMRQHGLQSDFVSMVPRDYEFQDQDILNIRCVGKIAYLHPRYNIHTMFDYLGNPDFCDDLFGPGAARVAVASPGIIHYAGRKPWQSNECWFYDVWWEYYRQTTNFSIEFYLEHQKSVLLGLEELRKLRLAVTRKVPVSWWRRFRGVIGGLWNRLSRFF